MRSAEEGSRYMKFLSGKTVVFIAVMIVSVILCTSVYGSNQINIEIVGQIVSFSRNVFMIDAPESGRLTITIRTKDTVYRIIETDVQTGKNKIEWDGLAYNQEKLYPMNYHVEADLSCESGVHYQARTDSRVYNCAQAMTLALPSSDKLYLSHPEEWFLETKVNRSGILVFEMISEGGTAASYIIHKNVEPLKINRLTFADIAGKKQISPGRYSIRIYEMSAPDYNKSITVDVEKERPEHMPAFVTGKTMPDENDNDEEIWRLMTQPAVVIDIGSTEHQSVYESPDENAPTLGTLHGQTQSLCVIAFQGDWALVEAWNHEEGEKITGWVPSQKLKVEYPNTEYGLLISKRSQTITVYHKGERIETISVCTGKMEKNKLYQETAAGSFLTGEHRVDYSTNGKKFDFVIQYDGGNLIHQIPYRFGEGIKDFTEGKALLGTKGSHACVRVQAAPGENAGINAYWIWTHIPYHTRVIILDDPEERREEKENLLEKQQKNDTGRSGKSGKQDAGAVWTAIPADDTNGTTGHEPSVAIREIRGQATENGESASDNMITVTFGGDAVLGGEEWHYGRDDSLMSYVEKNGLSYPFSGLQEFFETDDLTCINLECVLKEDDSEEDKTKEWRFRGLPEYAGILSEGSVEIVNIANNHSIDYGIKGYQETIQAIDEVVAWCGNNQPVAVKVKGHLIGFGGCRETTYKTDPGVILRDIQALKEAGCEFVVYQCHWGKEYDPHFNATQQMMAHACVIAGADMVIGHHPHVVQGIDYIENVPIIYSLGNLCFGGTIDLDGRAYDAMLIRAEITFTGISSEVNFRIIPIRTSSRASEGVNDFRPVPAEDYDAERILQYVQSDSGVELP